MKKDQSYSPKSPEHMKQVVADHVMGHTRITQDLSTELEKLGVDAKKVSEAYVKFQEAESQGHGNSSALFQNFLSTAEQTRDGKLIPEGKDAAVKYVLKTRELIRDAMQATGLEEQAYNEHFQKHVEAVYKELEAAGDPMAKAVVAAMKKSAETVREATGIFKRNLSGAGRAGAATVAVAALASGATLMASNSPKFDDQTGEKKHASVFKSVASVALLAVAAIGTLAAVTGKNPLAALKSGTEVAGSWVKKTAPKAASAAERG